MRKLLIAAVLFLSLPATAADDDDSAPAAVEVPTAPPVDPGQGKVLVAKLEDGVMINRGTREYLFSAFAAADRDPEIRAVVIVMDTPGGVLEDTRLLVKEMLNSNVPIVTYVAPRGSRAASAGLFLTMAGHVAAMAPGTHTGAAHPVFLGPRTSPEEEAEGDESKSNTDAMLDKVTEDTVAFIRDIAKLRGRDGDWGERAVRESIVASEDKALELGIVDLIAPSLEELLAEIDGTEVTLADGSSVVLRTKGEVVHHPWRLAFRLLYMLTDPTLAFLLLTAGLLGLGIEFRNPGLFVPGIGGAICLLLALFSLSSLPINLIALLFVLIGAGLVIADLFIPTYGLMTVGGVASLAFGGLFLINKTSEVPVGVSPVAVGFVAFSALVIGLVVGWVILRDRDRKVFTGDAGLLGAKGRVTQRIPGGEDDFGMVFVQSERWQAWATQPIAEGTRVSVRTVDGMLIEVAPLGAAD